MPIIDLIGTRQQPHRPDCHRPDYPAGRQPQFEGPPRGCAQPRRGMMDRDELWTIYEGQEQEGAVPEERETIMHGRPLSPLCRPPLAIYPSPWPSSLPGWSTTSLPTPSPFPPRFTFKHTGEGISGDRLFRRWTPYPFGQVPAPRPVPASGACPFLEQQPDHVPVAKPLEPPGVPPLVASDFFPIPQGTKEKRKNHHWNQPSKAQRKWVKRRRTSNASVNHPIQQTNSSMSPMDFNTGCSTCYACKQPLRPNVQFTNCCAENLLHTQGPIQEPAPNACLDTDITGFLHCWSSSHQVLLSSKA